MKHSEHKSGPAMWRVTRSKLIWLVIGLGLLFFGVSGVWIWMQSGESPPVIAIVPDVLPTSTPTSTSIATSEHATSTVAEVSLPTPTRHVVAKETPSPKVENVPTMTAPLATVTPSATSTPTLTPAPANAVRLAIPSIGVDAPVETVGVDANNFILPPSSPITVGWYSESAHPGEANNVVFDGHVDYHDYGRAVFYHLNELLPGDIIEVYTDNGGVVTYRVTGTQYFDANDDAGPVVGPTTTPVITLITCGGIFDPSTRSYDKRLVVRGELVTGSQ